jgi:two-component system, NtrC family, sensor kinase
VSLNVKIEAKFKSQLAPVVSRVLRDSVLVEGSATTVPDVIIGDFSFLQAVQLKSYQVLVLENDSIVSDQINELSRKGQLKVVSVNQANHLENSLDQIRLHFEKNRQILLIKSEIQKKRKELEQLNRQLTTESEKKIKFLERSHIEETEKNQNEKSLLHFLDFIQSESISDDFPEKLFRFIWKDLKKFGRIYTIGLSNLNPRGKSKISFYDGIGESTTVAQVDFKSPAVSNQLALAWGRPVGKIISWPLPEFSRQSYLFLEVVDQQLDVEKIKAYFAERIAVLSMYLDRWIIENEFQVVVERWKNTFKSFSGFTHVIDEDFKIHHANYAYDKDQSLNGNNYCYKILAKREAPCEQCPVVKNKNSSFALTPELHVKTYFSQFKFESKRFFFVIYEDVTKILMLQSQIIQTEKMSTLGRLGNHLAHELNNPLTGIKSYVQTLLTDSNSIQNLPNTAQTDLNEILKATVRCQKIIKNFIDFSQKKEPVLEKTTFNEVLQNTIILLKTALRNHRLFIDLKEDLILANTHDLQQVLFNLIKNSCQAMKTAGTLKIYQERIGTKIHFHVEDSGTGFDETILQNIFQPFMTTKIKGEGTGLGLYLSKKLINNMQAEMKVGSSPKGAKITLIFEAV